MNKVIETEVVDSIETIRRAQEGMREALEGLHNLPEQAYNEARRRGLTPHPTPKKERNARTALETEVLEK